MANFAFPNGVKVDINEMPELNTATICVDLLGGIQAETQLYNGMCEMISRLLLCGTKKHDSPTSLMQYAKSLGLVVEITAEIEYLQIKINCLKTNVIEAFEFINEILFSSLFEQNIINILKQQMKAEAKMLKLNPTIYLENLANQTLFSRTGLTNLRFGNERSLERITREKLIEQFSRFISPKNIVVSVGGAIDIDEVTEKIGNIFYTNLADNSYRQIKFVNHVNHTDGFVNIKNRKLNQSRVEISFPAYSYKDAGALNLQILAPIVENKLKAKLAGEQYFKSLSVKNVVYANNGKFCLSLAVDCDNALTFVQKTLEGLKEIVSNEEITKEEFDAQKNWEITNFVKTNESEEGLTISAARELLITKKPFILGNKFEELSNVELKKAASDLKNVIDFSKINVAYLGEPINFQFLGNLI